MSFRVEMMAKAVVFILFMVGSGVCISDLDIRYKEKDSDILLKISIPASKALHLALWSNSELVLSTNLGVKFRKLTKSAWNYLHITQDSVVLFASGKELQNTSIPSGYGQPMADNRQYRIKSQGTVFLHVCHDKCEQDFANASVQSTGAAIVILPMVSCLLIVGLVAVNVYYNTQMKSRFQRLFKETPFSRPVSDSWAPPPPPRINNHRGNQVNIITISSNNNTTTPEHYLEIVGNNLRPDVSVNALHNHRQSHSDTASDDNGYIQPIPVRDSLRNVPRPLLPKIVRPQK
ncbi:uncharacterized protein [Macrobrachium rosenbergii]|uniref:uncharacterized protein n=1 Tax=Macrobrachium rosenbergii TaxID=79674 RepID=UPI0034D45096